MIRAKVLDGKHSKWQSKPDFGGYFLQRLPCQKTELRSNDLRIEKFVLGKPYIVYMCIVGIHEMDITYINKSMTESKQTKT